MKADRHEHSSARLSEAEGLCPTCGGVVRAAQAPTIAILGVAVLLAASTFIALTAIALGVDVLGVPGEWIVVILMVGFAPYVAIRGLVMSRMQGHGAEPLFICNKCRRRFGEKAFSQLQLRPTWKRPLWLEIVIGVLLLSMTAAWWLWADSLIQHLIVAGGFGLVVMFGLWFKSLYTKGGT